jgi:uncharacterized protein with HEPN domain
VAQYARHAQPRIAHGYFDINLEVVWQTARTALPELLKHLPSEADDRKRSE